MPNDSGEQSRGVEERIEVDCYEFEDAETGLERFAVGIELERLE